MTRFVVVGIGAGGWADLSPGARSRLVAAGVVYGSTRQLALLPDEVGARRVPWRSPMSEHLAELVSASSSGAATADEPVVHVLASGDPMFHGVGASIAAAVGADRVEVLPSPSSVSLAAAGLGWDLARTEVVSVVTAPVESLLPHVTDGARLLVLSRDSGTPAAVAELLRRNGFGRSSLTVLGDLGADGESRADSTADEWGEQTAPALTVVGIECAGPSVTRLPALLDSDYENDGQLTKQPVRAMTVAALMPAEGQTLWDVGAGSGSIGIEWLRALDRGAVVAFESDPVRARTAAANAARHGVGHRYSVAGGAPEAFAAAREDGSPDTVFIGGGLDRELLEEAWDALRPGGRLVANAVTIESETILVEAAARCGGDLIRLSVERAAPLGRVTAWRPALPIVQWSVRKPSGEPS